VHPVYGQTVFSDHLICMEDGLTMKMLKRHLLTVHGMTPDEYRACLHRLGETQGSAARLLGVTERRRDA